MAESAPAALLALAQYYDAGFGLYRHGPFSPTAGPGLKKCY
jgi:hypothetical protein